jgi:nitrite reductase/ring-hydroxylating ferredoxin subunit/DMSO/TMAO reductase YedYZ heme-binding membrane subunit
MDGRTVSLGYQAVGWNRQKKIYDGLIVAGVVTYLGLFIGVGLLVRPEATVETLLIRAFGTAAFLLLHVILSIGPLCRLDRRFLPLLYNRRHLGVTAFLLGAVHGIFSLVQFHALGNVNPLVSLLTSNPRFDSLPQFPFQLLGLLALAVLFLMAATSHDFWLANLTAPVWKALHMLVYVAYGLLVLHVTLGVLQAETSPWLAATLAAGMIWVLGLHLLAGLRERRLDREAGGHEVEGFVDACGVDEIAEGRAQIVSLVGERVAIFRYDGKISAVSNVCQHQNGPLGEGKIVDGCITCPWHGFQYEPETGASPPPFTEKVPTFDVRVYRGRVLVNPRPNAPGQRAESGLIADRSEPSPTEQPEDEFFVGYLPRAPRAIAARSRAGVVLVFVVAVAAGLLMVNAQSRFAAAVFEFGVVREHTGVMRERPYPVLEVIRPGRTESGSTVSSYYLTAFGKHGAAEQVAGLDGKTVRVRGSLIYRDDKTMLEIENGSIEVVDDTPASTLAEEDLGRRTLRGEIVDSKCFLGVMKPGNLKPHRACAARCISGGVPPVLLVRDAEGAATYYLLVSDQGEPVQDQVIPLVAEPVEITGRVSRRGGLLTLSANPETYHRVE